jgi:hypothetical protein
MYLFTAFDVETLQRLYASRDIATELGDISAAMVFDAMIRALITLKNSEVCLDKSDSPVSTD